MVVFAAAEPNAVLAVVDAVAVLTLCVGGTEAAGSANTEQAWGQTFSRWALASNLDAGANNVVSAVAIPAALSVAVAVTTLHLLERNGVEFELLRAFAGKLVGDRSGLSSVAEVFTDSAISALEAAVVGFAGTIAVAGEGSAADGDRIAMTVSIAAMAMTVATLVAVTIMETLEAMATLVSVAALVTVAALVAVAAVIKAALVSPRLSLLFVETKPNAVNVVESSTVKTL